MAKPITFTATDPAGRVHKRTSKSRIYTHTVVYRLGAPYGDRVLAEELAYMRQQAPKDHAFHRSVIDRSWFYVGGKIGGRLRWDHITEEDMVRRGAEHEAHLAGLDVAAYTERRLEEIRANHEAKVTKGYYTSWHNAGWCGSLRLACKLKPHTRWAPAEMMILQAVREGGLK